MTTSPWVKASRSGDSGNCVEMRSHAGTVEVRDTKNQGAGPALAFSPAAFAAWRDAARRGELDHFA